MIVRILGEGQFQVDADVAARLTALGAQITVENANLPVERRRLRHPP